MKFVSIAAAIANLRAGAPLADFLIMCPPTAEVAEAILECVNKDCLFLADADANSNSAPARFIRKYCKLLKCSNFDCPDMEDVFFDMVMRSIKHRFKFPLQNDKDYAAERVVVAMTAIRKHKDVMSKELFRHLVLLLGLGMLETDREDTTERKAMAQKVFATDSEYPPANYEAPDVVALRGAIPEKDFMDIFRDLGKFYIQMKPRGTPFDDRVWIKQVAARLSGKDPTKMTNTEAVSYMRGATPTPEELIRVVSNIHVLDEGEHDGRRVYEMQHIILSHGGRTAEPHHIFQVDETNRAVFELAHKGKVQDCVLVQGLPTAPQQWRTAVENLEGKLAEEVPALLAAKKKAEKAQKAERCAWYLANLQEEKDKPAEDPSSIFKKLAFKKRKHMDSPDTKPDLQPAEQQRLEATETYLQSLPPHTAGLYPACTASTCTAV